MAATYQVAIASVARQIQPQWRLRKALNDVDVFEFTILCLDGTNRPTNGQEVEFTEHVVCLTSSAATDQITTAEPHGLTTGQLVGIAGHSGSVPDINGWHYATVVSPTVFTIGINLTTGGSGGTVLRRIFGGAVVEVNEEGFGGGAAPALKVAARGHSEIARKRVVNEVFPAGTLIAKLTRLVSAYLSANGVTLHALQDTGPDVVEMNGDYQTAEWLLENYSVQTGRPARIDEHKYLKMIEPGATSPVSMVAPTNITDANGLALADAGVLKRKLQTTYANRAILRYSAHARNAYAFLYVTGNFSNGETVTIGSKTYTYQTTLTDADGNVKIGSTKEESLTFLAAAVRLAGGAGSTYAASMTIHPTVTAVETNDLLRVTALTAGASGNSISVSDTAANASWVGEGLSPLTTLARGSDTALTNVAIADDAAEQAANGLSEQVIERPDVLDATQAQSLAEAYLEVLVDQPNEVTYATRALGLEPGQTQVITLAARAIDATYMITSVESVHEGGQLVRRVVKAISSTVIQSARSWTDFYRKLAGKTFGLGAALFGGPGGSQGFQMVGPPETFSGFTGAGRGIAFGVPDKAWLKIDPLNGVQVGYGNAPLLQVDDNGDLYVYGGDIYAGLNGSGYGRVGLWSANEAVTGGTPVPAAGLITQADGSNTDLLVHNTYGGGRVRIVGTQNSVEGPLNEPTYLSPSQLTADVNNYAPTGGSAARTWVLSSDATRTITGISAYANGRALRIVNGGVNTIVFAHDSGSSSAANRITCPGLANFTLHAGDTVDLWYDPAATRWRLMGF